MQWQTNDLFTSNTFLSTQTEFYHIQRNINYKCSSTDILNCKSKKWHRLPWWRCAGDRSKPPQSPESKWALSVWSRACLKGGKRRRRKRKKKQIKPHNMKSGSDARPLSARAAGATISLRWEEAFHVSWSNNNRLRHIRTHYEHMVLKGF